MTLEANRLSLEIDSRPIIRDASLEIRPGEILGIIGPNGAGKSTLLKSLTGVVSPASGEVRADGVTLASLRPRARATQVALVSQRAPIAAGLEVRDLVMLGRYARKRLLAASTQRDTAANPKGTR